MATQNAESDIGGDLPPAVVEDLLSDDTRRRALAILEARDEPVVVEDLAAAVVAAQEGDPVSTVPASEREAMAEELFTDHLPKLMATDVVDYDSMLGAVELRTDDSARQG
ncbi:DUF7344 domain-containing protein [Haloarcula salinisoli]|uniref:DUF7344 domain-containing protein n=1 Tax=Haloarcula salinisoli TaxID=2487746 RepID=A0A8J8CCB4_9EURY|nr:hypothetical protein [Halomicroarcula salinisoli]MBX0285227.1 hypothetical protein [Halomicroarcula salinisoli]MBX0303295.1 hypothetical protein [Halomicroarcula salinisoli]